LLKENKVDYLIIGGYATSVHSRPKYTKDMDVWINPTRSNAKKVYKVLEIFGTGSLKVSIEDLLDKNLVIQLGFPPVRIDILKDVPGIKFKEAYQNKIEIKWGKGKVNFLSVNDLLKNKEQTARKKDFQDIEWIKQYSKKPADK